MKKVLLVSEQSATGRLFLGEAKRVAETRRADLRFSATSLAELTPELMAEQDLVLLTPSVAYHTETQAALQTTTLTAVIPNDIYGWLNSEALVKFAQRQLLIEAVVA